MIQSLHIENVALIKKLNINLENGLNILSGETGAGKSIIIDSLNFVLGQRADKGMIRYGEESCFVSIAFDIDDSNTQVFEMLDELNIERENTIVIDRHFDVNGKNKCSINGRAVALSMLKNLTKLLVDIHGQSEHMSLLDSENHLLLIDKFAKNELEKEKVNELIKKYKDIQKQINALGGDAEERFKQIDILNFQIEEIEKANLKVNEDEELEAKRSRIINLEKILTALKNANYLFSESDSSIISGLKSASNELENISSYDDEVSKLSERLLSVYYEVEDIADSVESIANSYEVDEDIDCIEERLDLINKLKRKYGSTIDRILQYMDEQRQKVNNLIDADALIVNLTKEQEKVKNELFEACKKVSNIRKETALKMEKLITNELNDLSMKNSLFKASFNEDIEKDNFISKLNNSGFDSVEFLFSPNAGQPLKPLAKIISGGELSRFMLAVKNIVSNVDNIETLIFDEIDTGISGNVALVVAEKFAMISKKHQVIAISHLPQISAMADNNLFISKNVENNETITSVKTLNSDEKIAEVGRLSGGSEMGENTLLHAKDLIERSNAFKKSL